ncbi:MAG: BREX-1 system adenine-specific DNA-methyltransferase PglX, partial [Fastidiosipila sp.]|nr:BREX-1 system adenine-specific DNA-methyltransferase PglX [Fastidiosipila sp.]
IYESQGYSQRAAVRSILENNLYGLDIDKRAYQLSYFAVMMKARQHDSQILFIDVSCHVYAFEESNNLDGNLLKYFGYGLSEEEIGSATTQTLALLDTFIDAKEYGSIINVENYDWDLLLKFISEINPSVLESIHASRVENFSNHIKHLIKLGKVMTQKYDVVITNPPYMGSSNMNTKLSTFVKKYYPDSKADMYAIFIEKCGQMARPTGLQAMITQHTWMYLSCYEKLRIKLLNNSIVNMIHLGARAFEDIRGEVVQTTAFVINKREITNYKAKYIRLVDYRNQQSKENGFASKENHYIAKKEDFVKISGSPVSAYFLKPEIIDLFATSVGEFLDCKTGLICGNNNKYIRSWQEVNSNNINYNVMSLSDTIDVSEKWFPYNHGGKRIKWYGGHYEVVNMYNNAIEMRQEPNSMLRNSNFYFREGITWNRVGNGTNFHARIAMKGFVFDDCSPTGFTKELYELLAYLNSPIFSYFISLFSSGFKTEIGHVKKVAYRKIGNPLISSLCIDNIYLSKNDWDSFETSWDFKYHPLICSYDTIKMSFIKFKLEANDRFEKLKANEEEINRIFIDNYGLNNELSPGVEEKNVTISYIFDSRSDIPQSMKGNKFVVTKINAIKSLISYAVGCMFGRYSLDEEGLIFAGGKWDSSKYQSFIPDADGILPITEEAYFENDITSRFIEFIETVYGQETLEENLNFIADALRGKGEDSRTVIRNYFLTDFFQDHCKTYSVHGSGKRPIYWLYDSGKQNGFKALIYMHRYN